MNPNGRLTCPICRTILSTESDIKPVYLYDTAPEDIKTQFIKMSKENEQFARLLQESKDELKKIKTQLNEEKEKSKRLTSKYYAIEKKFKAAAKHSCYVCEPTTSSGRWKVTTTRAKNEVS